MATKVKTTEARRREVLGEMGVAWHEESKILLRTLDGRPQAIKAEREYLAMVERDLEQPASVYYDFDCYPLDGAVALYNVLRREYGYTPSRGSVIGVKVDHTGKTVQVPWGQLQIAGLEGALQCELCWAPPAKFIISGSIKKIDTHIVANLAEMVRAELRENSIYAGKTASIGFEWLREGNGLHPVNHAPKFVDVSGYTRDSVILPPETMRMLDLSLFGPIEHADAFRSLGVNIKRGILLTGVLGTGKSLVARLACSMANANGWTALIADSVYDLEQTLQVAGQYSTNKPALVFIEDIDRIASGERTVELDRLGFLLDGVVTKGREVMLLATTNDIDSINPMILRDGRFSAVIELPVPGVDEAKRLAMHYGGYLLEKGADMEEIGKALQGMIPATIEEVMSLAKSAACLRLDGSPKVKGKVAAQDVIDAAIYKRKHHQLVFGERKQPVPAGLARILMEVPANPADHQLAIKRLVNGRV